MANAILKYQNQTCPDFQKMPETKDLGAKRLKHFVGPDWWTFLELLHGKKLVALLTKRVQKRSTEESYWLLKEVVGSIKVVDDCAERSLWLVTDYHIERITRSHEQNLSTYRPEIKDKENRWEEKTFKEVNKKKWTTGFKPWIWPLVFWQIIGC